MKTQDLINACKAEWLSYVDHDYIQQLTQESLNKEAYFHYLQQDFLFLKHYSRAYALAIYKSSTLDEMKESLPSLTALLATEISHHVDYCKQFGFDEKSMEQVPEAAGTVAYTRYVLDCGLQGDRTDLMVALAPCGLGYAAIGLKHGHLLEANPNHAFKDWLSIYAADDFQGAAQVCSDRLDILMADIAIESAKGQRLCEIFKTATRMEAAFWQQALDAIAK